MRRLPNVYPADTTTWPNSEGTFDVGAAANNSKILMRNLTPLNLRLDFYNGSTDVLSAWEHNVWPLDGDSPTIGWSIDPDSPSVIAPPSNVVYLTLFDSTEKVPGTYPVFSVLQTSEGTPGGVQANVTQLVNTGNVANTNVITVNSTAAPGSTVTLSNDGLFQLLVTITGALVNAIKTQEVEPILQLGALTHLVEVLGNLKVDGTLEGVGNITADAALKTNTIRDNVNGNIAIDLSGGDGGVKIPLNKLVSSTGQLILDGTTGTDLYLNPTASGTGHKVSLSTNGAERISAQDDGAHILNSPLRFVSGRVSRFDKVNFTAAAGTYPTTKTYTHSLGYTPDFIWVMPGQNTAAFGSCTIGVWNWGATTFDVTLGAQINFQAFFIKLDP